LIDNADLFPEGESNTLSVNTFMRVHRICHQILRMFPTTEARYAILRDALKKATKSIYSIVYELTIQNLEHQENSDTYLPTEHRDLSPDHLLKLREDAVRKIEYWARIERLAEHPKLLPILQAWKAWGNESDCKTYVKKIIHEDRGLLAFLGAALKIPVEQTFTKLEKSADWKLYLDNITDFIPLDDVEGCAKNLFESEEFEKLREKEQLAILIFLDLINAQTSKVIPKTTV
jgi:hypothetical protein